MKYITNVKAHQQEDTKLPNTEFNKYAVDGVSKHS